MTQDWTPATLEVALRARATTHADLDPPGTARLKGPPVGSVEAADFLCETSSCVQRGEISDEKAEVPDGADAELWDDANYRMGWQAAERGLNSEHDWAKSESGWLPVKASGGGGGRMYRMVCGGQVFEESAVSEKIKAMSWAEIERRLSVQPRENSEQKGKALYCGSALVGWVGELAECVVGQVCAGCRWEIVAGEASTFSREAGVHYHDRCLPFYVSVAIDDWALAMSGGAAEPKKIAGHVFEGVGSSRRCVLPKHDGAAGEICGRYWDEISGGNCGVVGQGGKAHVGELTYDETEQVKREEERLGRVEAAMFSGMRLGR